MKALSLAAALGAVNSLADAAGPPPAKATEASFTSSQAYAGRFVYIANCAECHGGNLDGQFGPALAGPHSNLPWQTPGAVFSYMTQHMPVGNAGGLSRADYINIEAFLLQSNGRRANHKPLTITAIKGDLVELDGSR